MSENKQPVPEKSPGSERDPGSEKKAGFFRNCPLVVILIATLLLVSVPGFLYMRSQGSLSTVDLVTGRETFIGTVIQDRPITTEVQDAMDSLIAPIVPDEPSESSSISQASTSDDADPVESGSDEEASLAIEDSTANESAANETEDETVIDEASINESAAEGAVTEDTGSDNSAMNENTKEEPAIDEASANESAADSSAGKAASPESADSPSSSISIIPLQTVPREPAPPRCDMYDDPQVTALTTPAEYRQVEDDYFDDALFIGDSRFDGLAIYRSFANADFLSIKGVSLSSIYTMDMVYRSDGTVVAWKYPLLSLISSKEYGKIYIQLGINDMYAYNCDRYQELMQQLIDTIHEYQPDAIIFLTSIMNMTNDYDDATSSLNNDAINARNYRLALLADGKTVFYLDENAIFNDETGGLNPDYTFDGLHLTPEHYEDWLSFLKEHGI